MKACDPGICGLLLLIDILPDNEFPTAYFSRVKAHSTLSDAIIDDSAGSAMIS